MSQDLKLPFTLKAKQYQQNLDKLKADKATKKGGTVLDQPLDNSFPPYYKEIKEIKFLGEEKIY